jgi:hypothetical protein
MDRFDTMRLVYLLGVLLLISPALFMVFRERSVLLRNLAIWLGVAASAALLYVLLGRP